MGTLHWLTRRISPQPIAAVFGSEMIRFMQVRGTSEHTIQGAVEVANDDPAGISEALALFKGKRCVACLPTADVLVQHIRVSMEDGDQEILEQLMTHDNRWGNVEIRKICVKTTGSGGSSKKELLCVGVDRTIARTIMDTLETAGAKVAALTVPLYASIRAFDKLYRRDGDEKMTSMLIDMDEASSMVMIAHGANCVFAHRIESISSGMKADWKNTSQAHSATSTTSHTESNEFERRNENELRGLCGVQETNGGIETSFASELERCLRHHDALFPERAVDRVIFTGIGANDAERCGAIASELGIEGFIADPSAWITGASELAGGPAWTTAAGMCLRYSEIAA
jgi:Tfp pilus assembly PilM family ATPase